MKTLWLFPRASSKISRTYTNKTIFDLFGHTGTYESFGVNVHITSGAVPEDFFKTS